MSTDVYHHYPARIDLHLHVEGLQGVANSLQRIGDALMAISQDLKDLTAKIDDATNKVAARLDFLASQVKNSMTDDEVAAVKAGLQAEVDRLTKLGADPVNPVPPTP